MASAAVANTRGERPHKKPKRHKEHKKVDVSINSLLDVLSVILVFLMKSYSTTTVQVKPSKELQVPFSHSGQPVEESTSVTLTRNSILMNDIPVVELEKTKVPENALAEGGMLIQPLHEKMLEEVERQKRIATLNQNAEFKGIVSMICDRHVPFPLITQAMYTAGQAEYSTFKFILIKADRL
jgi:biopolymer transport protein ExbD